MAKLQDTLNEANQVCTFTNAIAILLRVFLFVNIILSTIIIQLTVLFPESLDI